jgi:mannose-6-phosphate isomerase-like protein (cupin superfamily)
MAAPSRVVDVRDKLSRIDEVWSPKILAEANGWHVKLVKGRGQFTWHRHPDVDEIFCVLSGSLTISTRPGGDVVLGPGSVYVVPRGVEHRPDAGDGCEMVLLEPEGVPNTGDAGGPRTAVDQWV